MRDSLMIFLKNDKLKVFVKNNFNVTDINILLFFSTWFRDYGLEDNLERYENHIEQTKTIT